MTIPKWIKDLGAVVYPRLCHVCDRSLVDGEEALCIECGAAMPRTMLHRHPFNTIHERIAGHTPVEKAAAWFYYERHSPYAALIHRAKYGSMPKLARRLGAMYARELQGEGFFDGVEMVQPVPLHRWKMITRGYNQSLEIARGICDVTGLPVGDCLISRRHGSQTRRTARERRLNAAGSYFADSVSGVGHILIVDDIITTGSTMRSCAGAIHAIAPDTRISVLALGLARLS